MMIVVRAVKLGKEEFQPKKRIFLFLFLGKEEIGLGLKGDSFGTVYAMGQQLARNRM